MQQPGIKYVHEHLVDLLWVLEKKIRKIILVIFTFVYSFKKKKTEVELLINAAI